MSEGIRSRLLYAALRLAGAPAPARSRSAARPELRPFRPGISILIPERANPELLADTLNYALAACRPIREPWEIVVAASGSPPSLYREIARRHGGDVTWLFSERPLWYCGAVRRGIEACHYDWVYLLNSDMLLDRRALEFSMEWRSPKVFAIASQVFFRDPGKRREETGWTTFRDTGGPIEILDEIAPDDETVRGTFYAGGGAALFRHYLLRDLARHSRAYEPFYWEDVEWGACAWRLGYESLYCPASQAWHLHRMTNRLFFSEAEIDRILARNRLVYHFRNGPPVHSLREFSRLLGALDEESRGEILEFRRIACIAAGRYRSSRLPADHIPLDQTWRERHGVAAGAGLP